MYRNLLNKYIDAKFELENTLMGKMLEILPDSDIDLDIFVDESDWGFTARSMNGLSDDEVEKVEADGWVYYDEDICLDGSMQYYFVAKER